MVRLKSVLSEEKMGQKQKFCVAEHWLGILFPDDVRTIQSDIQQYRLAIHAFGKPMVEMCTLGRWINVYDAHYLKRARIFSSMYRQDTNSRLTLHKKFEVN